MGEQTKTVPEAPRFNITLMGHTYRDVRAAFQAYQDPAAGAALVLYVDDDEFGFEEQLAVATVNLHQYGFIPEAGCAFIKDYAESEGMLGQLAMLGIVEATGRIEHGGFNDSVAFPEARFIGDWADRWLQAIVEGNAMRARTVADSGKDAR